MSTSGRSFSGLDVPHNHFPDPGLEFGAFRVMPQTTGGYIVVDTRRAPGQRQVGTYIFRRVEEAAEAAKRWHEEGHG